MDSSLDYDELIREELEEWAKEGVPDPASVINANTFYESIKLRAISQVLLDKFAITQEELDLAFKKEMLDALRDARQGLKQVRMKNIVKGVLH